MNNLDDMQDDNLLETDNSYWTDKQTAMKALANKPYFKTLVEEGFFKEYVFELVMELISRNGVDGDRALILEKLVGVAKLKEYFYMVDALSSSQDAYEEEVAKQEVEDRNTIVKLNAALEEAEKDEDFKLLVIDGYLTDNALNKTSMITEESVVRGGHRKEVLEDLAGVSVLRNWMVRVHKDVVYLANEEDDLED